MYKCKRTSENQIPKYAFSLFFIFHALVLGVLTAPHYHTAHWVFAMMAIDRKRKLHVKFMRTENFKTYWKYCGLHQRVNTFNCNTNKVLKKKILSSAHTKFTGHKQLFILFSLFLLIHSTWVCEHVNIHIFRPLYSMFVQNLHCCFESKHIVQNKLAYCCIY